MLAITLKDNTRDLPTPYASLMEVGAKTIETRTWPVPMGWRHHFPLDLLICASKASKSPNAGLAVCVVTLYECDVFKKEHLPDAYCDLYHGYAWKTHELRWLSQKFAVKGQLGLFQIELPPGVTLYTPTVEQIVAAREQLLIDFPA